MRSPANVETDVLQDPVLGTRIAKAQLGDVDGRAIELLRLLEADVGVLARGRPDLLDLDLLDGLAP